MQDEKRTLEVGKTIVAVKAVAHSAVKHSIVLANPVSAAFSAEGEDTQAAREVVRHSLWTLSAPTEVTDENKYL